MPNPRKIGRYHLKKKILDGDVAKGVPDLWEAHDAGDQFFIKVWKHKHTADADLRALWNREVRSLMRLQGYPGAAEIFARLHDLGITDALYYVVLTGGRYLLLSDVLKRRTKFHWLLNLTERPRRLRLWEGLQRIAEAIAVLHGEGTLHRSISSDAIFVGPEGQGDFRLSGFEWSIRVSGQDGAAKKVGKRGVMQAPELISSPGEYSTATDWYDFGVLAAEIFGISVKTIRSLENFHAAISELGFLREAEKQLILHLTNIYDQRLVSADQILQAIQKIVRDLASATVGAGRPVSLAIRISSDLEMARIIYAASDGKVSMSDPAEQRRWIERDLRGDIRIIARSAPSQHYVLRGEKLEYRVRQWTVDEHSSWDIGFCDTIEPIPKAKPDDQIYGLGERPLEIYLYPHARRTHKSIRDRSAPWDKVFGFKRTRYQISSDLKVVHDFFRVTQQLDTVLVAAQICPVRILDFSRGSAATEVTLTPRDESDRNELAAHLRLPRTSEQLRDWFKFGSEEVVGDDEERGPKGHQYQIFENRTMSGDGTSSPVWRFKSAVPHKEGPRYIFISEGSPRVRQGEFYLARNFTGTLQQIRRRHKAIDDMRGHEALLRLLHDPLTVSRESTDELAAGDPGILLDDAKLDALSRLWKTQPSFAIQGPPGTGKTTLVKAFADRLFSSDPSAQVLITAHSHHTVDDVLQKLDELFIKRPASRRPIMVRLGAKEATKHDVTPTSGALIKEIKKSEMLNAARSVFRDRLDDMLSEHPRNPDRAGVDIRTMQQLVQAAANVTFATSNALEVAEMASRGQRFDWSIIEEAGKAHGFDMAAALQESHRLLLIGDHRQLPPFNVRIFKDLLSEPLRVRKAIYSGAPFAPGLVDPSLVEDDEEREPLEDRCNRWRQMVNLFEIVFEASKGDEEGGGGPAATLTDQHRMHPDIAELVGRVFYPTGENKTILNSPAETHLRFKKPSPFESVEGAWLPNTRIVWCDVPWVQRTEYSEGETVGLFQAPAEVAAIIKILSQFKVRAGRACELQILSPYNDQLSAIRGAIDHEYDAKRLPAMFSEPFDIRQGKRMGATVDEFQGSEADIVIVSLVRNNALVPWKSVGFLKEANRMNVLLSRARHKLVLVGSWDFFNSRCKEPMSPGAEYAYIGKMMDVMTEFEKTGKLARIGIPT